MAWPWCAVPHRSLEARPLPPCPTHPRPTLIAAAKGYPFVCIMSEAFSIERRKMMRCVSRDLNRGLAVV